jgi:muramidase (phage lysozyme)
LRTFDDYADHPYNKSKSHDGGTAAGAYQILKPTFNLFSKAYEGLDDFTPQSQDKFAIAIFKEVKALGDIQSGNLSNAIKKLTKKPVQFASLPGGGQDHGLTTEKIKEAVSQPEAVFLLFFVGFSVCFLYIYI